MGSLAFIKALHEKIVTVLDTIQPVQFVQILQPRPSTIKGGNFLPVKLYTVSSRRENFKDSGRKLVDPETASGRLLASSALHRQNVLCALIRIGNALLELKNPKACLSASPEMMRELADITLSAEAKAHVLVNRTKQQPWYADEPKRRAEEAIWNLKIPLNRIQMFSDLALEIKDEAKDDDAYWRWYKARERFQELQCRMILYLPDLSNTLNYISHRESYDKDSRHSLPCNAAYYSLIRNALDAFDSIELMEWIKPCFKAMKVLCQFDQLQAIITCLELFLPIVAAVAKDEARDCAKVIKDFAEMKGIKRDVDWRAGLPEYTLGEDGRSAK